MYRELDLQILALLQQDGRASLRQLAGRLNVAPTTVNNRIRALQRRGILRGSKAVLDYSKLGYTVTAVILIKAQGKHIPLIAQELRDDPQLTHVYEITGDYDLLVVGKFRDQDAMNREIKKLLANPAIEHTHTSVVLNVAKEEGPIELLPNAGRPAPGR